MNIRVLILFFLCSSMAHAQIAYPAAALQNRPELAGFKKQGDTLSNGKASVRIKLKGNYLEQASVSIEDGNLERAGSLLGALTGYGDGLGKPYVDYLKRSTKALAQPGGASILAEEFTLSTQLQGKRLGFNVKLTETPSDWFALTDNVLGSADARVVVRVFSDFQCPYCEALEQNVLIEFRRKLPNDVRLEFHHFPLESIHPNARSSAEASECAAEQGQFWAYHDALFTNRNWVSQGNPIETYFGLADTLNLDAAKFRECVQTRKHQPRISFESAKAQRLGLRGTPTVFVNGFKLGQSDAPTLERMVDFARQ